MESQKKQARVYSFEFFPPKTDRGVDKLRTARAELEKLKPRFFSVTFGAGGSTRERTFETAYEIQRESSIEAAPHLSCVGSTKDSIREIINLYRKENIHHIVALRGDLPSGMGQPGEFRYANELVDFIREESGDHFHIEVAAYPESHPQASNANTDLENFKRKIDAGADSAITQYFYNPYAYFNFIERCENIGITIPIVPGIMPITNHTQLARFSDMCGAEIPRWVRKQLEAYADDLDSIRSFGEDMVTEMCQTLLDAGAPGLHFYTMNQSAPSTAIWNKLNLIDPATG